jgi:hypothetical protein
VLRADIGDLIEGETGPSTPLVDPRRRGLELAGYELQDVRAGRLTVELGPGWAAWFADPATNELGVLQYR